MSILYLLQMEDGSVIYKGRSGVCLLLCDRYTKAACCICGALCCGRVIALERLAMAVVWLKCIIAMLY